MIGIVIIILVVLAGSGFQSKHEYLFGSMSMSIKLIQGNSAGTVTTFYMLIKLIQGNSAGTVTTFYMSSDEPSHDELDFEFLGTVPGQPYTLQTNVFVNGIGNREQRINLWFDPTVAFHNYSILWNHKQIVFWVYSIPIRLFKNIEESAGIPYPSTRPMRIHTSLWNGSNWATDGGRVKIDWSKAPFVASYISFQVNGCSAPSNSSAPCANNWWEQPEFQSLNEQQLSKLDWVRKNYLTYDYCEDRSRRSSPAECAVNL
eukprot:PITA_06544